MSMDGGELEGRIAALIAGLGMPAAHDCTLALLRIGHPAVPQLICALEGGKEELRSKVAMILGSAKDPSARAALRKAFGDEGSDARIRSSALWALGKQGDPGDVALFVEALSAGDAEWRRLAARGIENVASNDPEYDWSPLLGSFREFVGKSELEGHHESQARAGIIGVLGQVKDKGSVQMLIRCLRDDDGLVRASAATSLGLIGDPSAGPALIEAFEEEMRGIRLECFKALVLLKDPAAIRISIDARLDPDRETREEAQCVLADKELLKKADLGSVIKALKLHLEVVRARGDLKGSEEARAWAFGFLKRCSQEIRGTKSAMGPGLPDEGKIKPPAGGKPFFRARRSRIHA